MSFSLLLKIMDEGEDDETPLPLPPLPDLDEIKLFSPWPVCCSRLRLINSMSSFFSHSCRSRPSQCENNGDFSHMRCSVVYGLCVLVVSDEDSMLRYVSSWLLNRMSSSMVCENCIWFFSRLFRSRSSFSPTRFTKPFENRIYSQNIII